LFVVAEPGQAVLAPAVGPAAGLLVRQVAPGVAAGAVVLADGAPLPLAEVRPPLLPGPAAEAVLLQALLFRGHARVLRGHVSPESVHGRRRTGAGVDVPPPPRGG